jgi:hypothetical protein
VTAFAEKYSACFVKNSGLFGEKAGRDSGISGSGGRQPGWRAACGAVCAGEAAGVLPG